MFRPQGLFTLHETLLFQVAFRLEWHLESTPSPTNTFQLIDSFFFAGDLQLSLPLTLMLLMHAENISQMFFHATFWICNCRWYVSSGAVILYPLFYCLSVFSFLHCIFITLSAAFNISRHLPALVPFFRVSNSYSFSDWSSLILIFLSE